MIRPVKAGDAVSIATIYNYYIKNTVITFEEIPVSINEIGKRIREIGAKYPWLVWEESGAVTGYAYADAWKERSAYRRAAELSIYIKPDFQGKGIGRALFSRVLEEVRKTGIHALVSGITLPNEASVALHEKFGFKNIACFNEIGFKSGKWLDVGYWELILPPDGTEAPD
ncbi:MAG: GNAT family N-acetyltransferase [Treponema sp.]|jgi:phosphinothricin acetyltransferase|nr:GNAT family N-acetyltransferase [Treponema sp.]